MSDLMTNIACGLLGFGTGIFTVLSLIEKPVWRLMRDSRSERVSDADARAVHAILKRVIHMLPPTMMVTMGGVSVLIAVQLYFGPPRATAIVAAVFFSQLLLTLRVLFKAIRGVDSVPSDGDIRQVRDGLGALERVHHQGLLMTASTLVAQWFLVAVP